jgi:hypothetical protein
MKTIMVGGKEVQLMEDDDIRNPICMDCGMDTDATDESYMILNEPVACSRSDRARDALCWLS